jgi:hypothetical protein
MRKHLRPGVLFVGSVLLLLASIRFALTQTANTGMPQWMPMAWLQALRAPLLPGILRGTPPPTLPPTMNFADLHGIVSTYRSDGLPVNTSQTSFFASLGTNGRTCMTCHEPNDGWSITLRQCWLPTC